jgi:quercetin dioxygenase-like cupin family protein
VTLLEGGVTIRVGDTTRLIRAGETLVEHPGEFVSVASSPDETTRLVVTYLLPSRAELTTLEQGVSLGSLPPGPITVAEAKLEAEFPPGPRQLLQRVLELPPGSVETVQSGPGTAFVLLLTGEVTARAQGAERRASPGDGWALPPNGEAMYTNSGAAASRLLVAAFLPAVTPRLPASSAPSAVTPRTETVSAAGPLAPAQLPRKLPRTGEAREPLLPLTAAGLVLLFAGLLVSGQARRLERSE